MVGLWELDCRGDCSCLRPLVVVKVSTGWGAGVEGGLLVSGHKEHRGEALAFSAPRERFLEYVASRTSLLLEDQPRAGARLGTQAVQNPFFLFFSFFKWKFEEILNRM